MVSVLPFHSPIELAEQYATVDRLAEGRLNLGVGSGYLPKEFAGFGADPKQKGEVFERRLRVLLRAFAGKTVRAEGIGSAPVRINVRPVQRPHPPIWIAARHSDSIQSAARRGHSLALAPYANCSSWDDLGDRIARFRGGLPPGSCAEVAAVLHLYAGSHPRRARLALKRFLGPRFPAGPSPDSPTPAPDRKDPVSLEENGWAIFGSSIDVAKRLLEFRALGVDEVLRMFDFGGLPIEDVEESVRALGPAFAAMPTVSEPPGSS
jgi:alkanesulfonate monooxygenase SsuD/methylene tetrahydromethanopterin reductase-like flavin-dependent oxidoreductase (luciferase family)